jgi:hypothetical protein
MKFKVELTGTKALGVGCADGQNEDVDDSNEFHLTINIIA